MPGTEKAYGAMLLRACYAMPGTDVAYGATRQRARGWRYRAASYWYGPTRCPVLTQRMHARLPWVTGYLPTPALCDVRY
eukprot:974010-Rhodomonas_salina.2